MALDRDRFEQNRVDGYLDALGRGERPEALDASDDALNSLFLEWREDLGAAPLPAGPSQAQIDAALSGAAGAGVTSLAAARERKAARGRRSRSSRNAIAVGAAAVAAVAIGSLSVMAYSAQPGDPLWGVNKTMFSHNATDIELVASLQRDLDAANAALANGDTHTAAQLVQSVSERLDGVQSAADRVNLIRLRDQIERDISRGQAAPEATVPTPSAQPTPVPQPEIVPAPRPVPPVPTTSAQPMPTIAPAPTPTSQLPALPPKVPPVPTQPLPTIVPPSSVPPVSPLDPSILELRSVPTSQPSDAGTGGNAADSQDSGTGNNAQDPRLGK